MKDGYRILAVGDVVGKEAALKAAAAIRSVKSAYKADLVIVNGENAADGNGLDPAGADRLFSSGVDIITSGNHIFKKREIQPYLDAHPFLLRPANYPQGTPGSGAVIFESFGCRILVMNVLGTVYMEPLADPFLTVQSLLHRYEGQYDCAVLDVHAEATSEKIALARCFDGKISAVFGTHTHVQTSDACVFPGGTGFITDLGMSGPYDSILGVDVDCILQKFRTKLPVHFKVPEGLCRMEGAVFEIDGKTRMARSVNAFRCDIG